MKPTPRVGEMYQSPSARSSIRCKVYDGPPMTGRYIRTLEVEEIFGPVLDSLDSDRFVTIRVEEGWINIWTSRHTRGRGVLFAHSVGIDHRIANSE